MASSSGSNELVGPAPSLQERNGIDIDVLASSEKLASRPLFRGLQHRPIAMSTAQGVPSLDDNVNATVEGSLSGDHGTETSESPPQYDSYDTDGGVRLAGGRPGEVSVEGPGQRNAARISDGSTLPPPYSSHFGDSET